MLEDYFHPDEITNTQHYQMYVSFSFDTKKSACVVSIYLPQKSTLSGYCKMIMHMQKATIIDSALLNVSKVTG